MDELIELENTVSADGMRVLHLISNLEISLDDLKSYDLPADANVEIKKEVGAFHVRASYPIHGLLRMESDGWPAAKHLVVWHFSLCESISKAIHKAAERYLELFGDVPQYAFIRRLPRGIDNGTQVGDVVLLEAEWMISKCVAVYSPG
jgi:hypothetical protein